MMAGQSWRSLSGTVERLRGYILERWPLAWRATLKAERREHIPPLAELLADMRRQALIAGLVQVGVVKQGLRPLRYVLQVEISDALVRQFLPGNTVEIRYLAGMVASAVEREIVSINFARVAETGK
jgi:hypothetical protein